jgi:mono/diheme cytochrome c family protein
MRATHVGWSLGLLVALGLAIQFVPYGRTQENPPTRQEPPWDSPATRALAVRACFDCHSNQTVWPWYARVAPGSWLIQHDVEEGRRKLNFSEWDRPQRGAPKMGREIARGEMPPWYYTMIHAEARLSEAERRLLVKGVEAPR